MVKNLLDLIPDHSHYVEPFAGGASLFWSKRESKMESLNDLQMNVVAVYRTLKSQPKILAEMIADTIHHEGLFKECREKLKTELCELERAFCFLYCTMGCFGSAFSTFGFSFEERHKFKSRKERFFKQCRFFHKSS